MLYIAFFSDGAIQARSKHTHDALFDSAVAAAAHNVLRTIHRDRWSARDVKLHWMQRGPVDACSPTVAGAYPWRPTVGRRGGDDATTAARRVDDDSFYDPRPPHDAMRSFQTFHRRKTRWIKTANVLERVFRVSDIRSLARSFGNIVLIV